MPGSASPIIEPRAFLTTVAKRVLFNYYRRQDLERAYLDALAQMPGVTGNTFNDNHPGSS